MSNQHPVETALENRLMGQGLYVTAFEQLEDGERLEYEVVSESPTVTSREVSVVVRTVLTLDEERENWSPGTLEATSYATDGTVRGTWFVDREWFARLHEDLSEVEFSTLVLDTITG